MLELVDLFEFEVIVAPKLGVASSHGVGGFQQVVAEIAVARLDKFGVLGLEIAGLVLCPNQAGVFGNGCLRLKAVDVSDLGDDTGGMDLTNAGDRGQRIGNDLKLLLNGLAQNFDLAVQGSHSGDGDRHGLIYGVVHCLGQAIRASGRYLYCFCGGF